MMVELGTANKWELLGALYKHGCDVDKIKKELNLEEPEIIKAIKHYKIAAQRAVKTRKSDDNLESIDRWLKFINDCNEVEGNGISSKKRGRENENEESENVDNSFLLSKALMYAADYENHFCGESPDEPNYNEIYRYLGQLLAGREPTQLRPANAQKVLDMVDRIKDVLKDESSQHYKDYINEHEVSYLKSGADAWTMLKKKKTNYDIDDDISDEDTDDLTLAPDDADYITKRDALVKKCLMKQQSLATKLDGMPGINPLEIELSALVKPEKFINLTSSLKKRRYKTERK